MSTKHIITMLALLASLNSVPAHAAKASELDIARTVKQTSNLKYLSDSLQHVGITHVLQQKGPLTLFAPEDKIFSKLSYRKWLDIWDDTKTFKTSLMQGIVSGKIEQAQLDSSPILHTISGAPLKVEHQGKDIWIGTAKVKNTIECTNGIIYVIDGLLGPSGTKIAKKG